MSLFTRLRNAFTRQRLHNELDEELADHIHHAIQSGRTREEAEKAFGNRLRHREASADLKLATWLDSLRADAIFGYRQLKRRPAATISAILSLALAYDGLDIDAFSYPLYKQFSTAVKGKADLFLLSYTTRNDITYSTENEMEKAYRQYVSGNHFSAFGLQPELGRLITETSLMTDIFVHAMQNARAIPAPHWAWTRIWLRPKPGVPLIQLQQQLQAI
ncbi:MAG: hypothetical protein U0R19_28585 [Bryobacteraceae bacterium]